MEEEIEDTVGEVRLTDSQKSVATSAATSCVYSGGFTDSSPERRGSSSKDTYVIEQSSSSDSESFPVHADCTVLSLAAGARRDAAAQWQAGTPRAGHAATQTSRTVLQLHTLHTQTSRVSVADSGALRIERKQLVETDVVTVLTSALDDRSSKFYPTDSDTFRSDENSSEVSSEDRIINILDAESRDYILSDGRQGTGRDERTSESGDSDRSVDPDSLMEATDRGVCSPGGASDVIPKSIDDEIEALYNKLAGSHEQLARAQHSALTPLTEESTVNTAMRESVQVVTPETKNVEPAAEDHDEDVVFTNFAGGKVKILPRGASELKLPPLGQRSCPSSPQLNFLFSVGGGAGRLPSLQEAPARGLPRWQLQHLAAGESALGTGSGDLMRSAGSIHLPPIHIEGYVVESKISKAAPPADRTDPPDGPLSREAISIRDRIKELKMAKSSNCRVQSRAESRSCSPGSGAGCARGKPSEAAERGGDALCQDLLRRLRAAPWYEVSDTLEELPGALENFWSVISENRIADLIRLVSACVESPRTAVSRAACASLAAILRHTNYTKKPDFNEAVALLLTKTGSFSRPVRRAANLALDAVACGLGAAHTVPALALGAGHKSGAVRAAAARLLVVASAWAGGGRGLLRARPPTAAAARRLALRALADLLDDKHTDARRYAERLYAMLRPLANFEAYYLTDVEVERATRHMNKYDRSLQAPAR